MDDHGQDAIDFKPFFDMVVGVLFILLILVAAQMFFAQWQPPASQARTAEQQERIRREELEREVQMFLGRLEKRLDGLGIAASADRLGRSVSFADAPLRAASGAWSAGTLATVAGALRGELSCLGQDLAPEPDCPAYRHLKLRHFETSLGLAGRGAGGTPPSTARVLALEFSALLYRAAPELLSLQAPAGGPAVDSSARINAPGSAPAGRVELRFGFADAQ